MNIEKEVNELFEKAEKEQYVHSRSKETFDDVASWWFGDERISATLANLACKYVVSSCLLQLLGMIHKQDFSNVFPIKSIDLTDYNETSKVADGLAEIPDNVNIWYRETLFPAVEKILRKAEAFDLEALARIGNMADSTVTFAEHALAAGIETWVYDCVWQFKEMVLGERSK